MVLALRYLLLCVVATALGPADTNLPPLQIDNSLSSTSFCDDAAWTQVWHDEFTAPSLDTTSWDIDLNAGDSRVRDSQGTTDNVYIENGDLVLRSQKQQQGKYNFTSGAVQTQGKKSWEGLTRVCIRAQLPGGGGGDGIWPAHWLMPDNKKCWPSNGEIDIMEMIDGDGTTHGTYHWQVNGSCGDSPHKHPSIGSSVRIQHWEQYHEYAVEYSPTHIAWALDGKGACIGSGV
jgi:beta-glucanase (GH16 family)